DVRLIGGQMAIRHRHVNGFDYDAALPMQHTERMRQLNDVAERGDVTVAPAVLAVADVRCAGDGPEVDDVVADVEMPRRIPRMQYETCRGLRELRLHDVAAETHHLRFVIHQRAGAPEGIARRGAADFEARLLEHPECGDEDAFNLLG